MGATQASSRPALRSWKGAWIKASFDSFRGKCSGNRGSWHGRSNRVTGAPIHLSSDNAKLSRHHREDSILPMDMCQMLKISDARFPAQVHCCLLKVDRAQAVFAAARASVEGDSLAHGWAVCTGCKQEISLIS